MANVRVIYLVNLLQRCDVLLIYIQNRLKATAELLSIILSNINVLIVQQLGFFWKNLIFKNFVKYFLHLQHWNLKYVLIWFFEHCDRNFHLSYFYVCSFLTYLGLHQLFKFFNMHSLILDILEAFFSELFYTIISHGEILAKVIRLEILQRNVNFHIF